MADFPINSRKMVGLRNLGNTCFLNTSIQCLMAVPPLYEYFQKYFRESEVNERGTHGLKGKLAREFHTFLQEEKTSRENSVLNPGNIRQLVIRHAPQFQVSSILELRI
jgi:ubiquitin C-terminal hydrolase